MSAQTHEHRGLKHKIRIVFFVPWITKGRGGTENVGHLMANSMAERGHHVDVFTFDEKKEPSLWPLRPEVHLHYLELDSTPAADSRMLFAVAQRNPDLIVGLHMNRTMLRYMWCGRKLGVPVVLSEHIDPRFPERVGTFSKEERLLAFHGSTRIHLLVEAFRQSLPEHMQSKICVIPNTVPAAREKIIPNGDSDRQTLVTVARLVPRKNISRLLGEFAPLLSQFPNWQLQIIGDGPERKRLETQALQLGMAASVQFVGEVQDPYPLLARAQVFVLPSLFEGFPLSSLEAMAHGLPLVGYAVCNGINEQIVDGKNGLLVASSSSRGSLADALKIIFSNSELRERMGRASLDRFSSHYSNQIVFSEWESLFLQAANSAIPSERPALASRLDGLVDKTVFESLPW